MKNICYAWFLASRPKTLTASLVPVLTGTALAFHKIGGVQWIFSLYALLVALFIQIGTNLVNDALDFKKGADNKDRLGPKRVTQSGLLSMKAVMRGGILCFAVSMLFAIPLIFKGGIPLLCILLLSLLCGYLYTGGPYPLAYHGLGDFFVLVFFGFVATGAVDYIQTGSVGLTTLLAGGQVGLLSCVMIAINNLRDIKSDLSAGKLTLAARFGIRFGRLEITLLILLPFALNLLWLLAGSPQTAVYPLFLFPTALFLIRNIWNHDPSPVYNYFLGLAALLHFLFGLLLSLGLFLR